MSALAFYSFAEIRATANCIDIAKELYGCHVNGTGRTAAKWRGGDDPDNVSIEKTRWHDHVEKKGGGPIELAAFKFNGDTQAAARWLGERYRLTPKHRTGPAPSHEGRREQLLRDGWEHVKRYEYRDASGALIHFVDRFQHPDKPKEKTFLQGIADGESTKDGMHGTPTILYRLNWVRSSPWCIICEGEKSADRMNALGIPATTCAMGSKKWHSGLNEPLRGKDVAVFPDNDAPGQEHAQLVAASLHGIAASVRIVPPAPGLVEKQGIDDWIDLGHTQDDVLALIAAAPPYTPPADILTACIESCPTEAMLAEAKTANKIPFRNYIPEEIETEKRGRKVKEIRRISRTHRAMLDDLNKRFLGFPRKCGNALLFDHDRDSGKIIDLDYPVELKAWICRRSKLNAEFAQGDNLVTETEFYKSVLVEAHSYESISEVPDWPRRAEVYYSHDNIPPATSGHRYLNEFVDMFLPTTEYDKCLIRAFVACPLWYVPGISRPTWVIDSRDGQGSGKTNLVELVSELYGAPPITVCRADLERDMKEVRKRCVSRTGRNARIFLVDNVTGNFRSPELASMISYKHISGMAPYGHGEESRENNLVFCITSNSASLDTDLGDRSLFIYVRKPTPSQRNGWKDRIQKFIKAHRLNIVADVIDLVSKHRPYGIETRTRFAEFEENILQPCCGDAETVREVIDHVFSARADANIDEDHARSIIDTFTFNIAKLLPTHHDGPVFIQTSIVNSWGGSAMAETRGKDAKDLPIQIVRNLAKAHLIPQIDSEIKKWPTSSKFKRYSGIAWNFRDTTESAPVITLDAEKQATVTWIRGDEA
jgi:hypothetical protein